MTKKKIDTDDWIPLSEEVPVSDIPILVYSLGKVYPAKHSHTKFFDFGMQHFFQILGVDNSHSYITNVSQWRKMPKPPAEPTKEWKPD